MPIPYSIVVVIVSYRSHEHSTDTNLVNVAGFVETYPTRSLADLPQLQPT